MTMTAKGFLHKARPNVSALAFIEAHREYLTKGEVSGHTAPIVAKLDAKELLPTPALDEIKAAVFSHLMIAEAAKAQKAIARANGEDTESEGRAPRVPKAYRANIVDESLNVVTEKKDGKDVSLSKEFDLYQDAERWVDRRLFDNPGCIGEIATTRETDSKGNPRIYNVSREASMARILRQPGKPVCKGEGKGGGGLGFGVKCKQDRAVFSHGLAISHRRLE